MPSSNQHSACGAAPEPTRSTRRHLSGHPTDQYLKSPGRITRLPFEELLPTVNIVRCSGEGCVLHDVDGERGDVVRADHATDGQRGAQALATRLELITQE